MHRRFRVSGVELCDDHHTHLPLLFLALTPTLPEVFNPIAPRLVVSWPSVSPNLVMASCSLGKRYDDAVAFAHQRAKFPNDFDETLISRSADSPLVRRLNRLDRVPRKIDPLLTAEQMQQYQDTLVRTQSSEHPNLLM